MKASGRGL